MKVMIVDPPSGWMYGFPKVVPNDESPSEDWFLRNGYPQELIDQGALQHVRYWFKEETTKQEMVGIGF